MDKITIGIEKRVSMSVLEMAIRAVLDDTLTDSYFQELASIECTGANRIKKTIVLLRRLTIKNKLLTYMKENKEMVSSILNGKIDKPIFFTAVMCSSYTIFYDTVSILGKYFHAQDTVNRAFLIQKLSEKYGSNRSLDVAFDCVLPMLIDAGIIKRAGKGVYSIVKQTKLSDGVLKIYKQSFLLNNPLEKENGDFERNPYFEFID